MAAADDDDLKLEDIIHPAWLEPLKAVIEPHADAHAILGIGRPNGIIPSRELTFHALQHHAPEDWNVVIFGKKPFPRAGSSIGIAFCDNMVKDWTDSMSSSLRNIIKRVLISENFMSKDEKVGRIRQVLAKENIAAPTEWFKHTITEGRCLWLNTSLTCPVDGTDRKHDSFWAPIAKKIINVILEAKRGLKSLGKPAGVVFVLWGSEAKKLKSAINKCMRGMPASSRPDVRFVEANSPVVESFNDVDSFGTINSHLADMALPPICWLPKRTQKEPTTAESWNIPSFVSSEGKVASPQGKAAPRANETAVASPPVDLQQFRYTKTKVATSPRSPRMQVPTKVYGKRRAEEIRAGDTIEATLHNSYIPSEGVPRIKRARMSASPNSKGSKKEVSARAFDSCKVDYSEVVEGKKLGAGAFGEVRKAKWRGNVIAVKLLHQLDSKQLDMFYGEAALLVKLRHPNIVACLGVSVDPPALIMEYMPSSLLNELNEAPNRLIAMPSVLAYMLGISVGMHYLHMCNPEVIHRDLKPANILVDKSCMAKIADFGVSREKFDSCTMTRVGTPHYMAPEILQAIRYNKSVDVYSFGMVLYQVLSGKVPFAGMGPDGGHLNPMQVVMKVAVQKQRPVVPDDDTRPNAAALLDLMQRCWAHNPEDRPSFDIIRKELEALQPPNT